MPRSPSHPRLMRIPWVSLLLSNAFLHYVLDVWFEQDVKPRLGERAFLVR